MTTYKGIKGFSIQTVAGDPSNLTTGQIWYDSGSQKIQGAKLVAGSWASGGNVNTGRTQVKGCGTQTAALATAGQVTSFGTNPTNINELYDGTSWTEVGDLNTARRTGAEFGISTAAIYAGGYAPPCGQLIVESYDGSSWTEVGDLTTASGGEGGTRYHFAGFGTATAGAVVAGSAPNPGNVETWDGSSWTEVADINTQRGNIAASTQGTTTASIVMGGEDTGPTALTVTESWDGSSWTEVGDLNTGLFASGHAGTQAAASIFGGTNPGVTTHEQWDGTNWSASAALNAGKKWLASAGSATAALAATGSPAPPAPAATEEFTGPAVTASTFTSS